MTIDEINEEWSKDAMIDGANLFSEQQRLTLLHPKYYREYLAANARLRDENNKLSVLQRLKTEYYGGVMDPAEVRSRGWPALQHKPLRADVPTYVETDDDVIKQSTKVGMFSDKVKYLDSILKRIQWQHAEVKNMIEWAKFSKGMG